MLDPDKRSALLALLGTGAELTQDDLARRLEAPMSAQEFEARVAPWRARFALTGDGPRFMQAHAPFDERYRVDEQRTAEKRNVELRTVSMAIP